MTKLFNKRSTKRSTANNNERPMGSMDSKPKKSVRGAIKKVASAATNELVASAAGMVANVAVVKATTNTMVAATNAAYNIHGMIKPHTVECKTHRFGRTKTMTQQEAITLINKGKKLRNVKSNAWLDQPKNNARVQTAIAGTALAAGAVSGITTRKEVKNYLDTRFTCPDFIGDDEFEDFDEVYVDED